MTAGQIAGMTHRLATDAGLRAIKIAPGAWMVTMRGLRRSPVMSIAGGGM